MSAIQVVLIDDHSLVREGLKQLLELDDEIRVVGEAGDGKAGLQIIQKLNPDVILLDIDMPVMDGIQLLKELKKNDCAYKVLILTIHNNVEYLLQALELGASGYVLKDSDSATLKKAIFSVFEGNRYIDMTLTPILKEKTYMESINQERKEKDALLTSREIEVLKLVARGLQNRDIANQLQISEKTVKNHAFNLFKKIGVSDRTQAAVYAIKHDYVEL